jgi:hypothetical protein
MTMGLSLRKFALTAHVTSSVGWLGAVASFLALAVVGLTSQDAMVVRAVNLANELTAWYVIVPLSFASPLTGILQSMGTKWGLFRHYWVLIKFLITIPCTVLLLLHMQPIHALARVAAVTNFSCTDLGLQSQLAGKAGAALVVLLVATTLSVYTPEGVTRWGQ